MKLNKISADMVSRRPDQTAEWLNRLARQVDIVEASATSSGKKSGDLPIATTHSLGVVKIGQNLSITPEGVLSAIAPTSYSYALLFNKPKINNVELIGNKSLHDLGIDIPTKTSELSNDGSDGTSTYVELADLATVATSGAYADLSGKPTNLSDFNNDVGYITSADLPTKTSDLQNDGSDGASTYVEADELATVATSGSYSDLLDKPTIGNATIKIQKNSVDVDSFTTNATANKTIDISVPTSTSNLTNDGADGVSPFVDSTTLASDLALKQDKLIAGSNIQIAADGKTISATGTTYSAGNGLSLNGTTFSADTTVLATQADITALGNAKQDKLTVAQQAAVDSGIDTTKVAKLDGIEAGAEVNVQADWNEADSSSDAYIKNKPSLATVATSGSYNDLTNKPTIPAAQVNSDWNANSGVAQILNKPSLATVATSGSYNDLTNKPTIPTVNDATLTIQKNGSTVKTFTANASSNVTANIAVPTNTSDLMNDSGFVIIDVTNVDPGEGSALGEDEYVAVYGSGANVPEFTLTNTDPGEGVALGEDEYIGVYGSPQGIQQDELDWSSVGDQFKACPRQDFTSAASAWTSSYPSNWTFTVDTVPGATYFVHIHTSYLVCETDTGELDLEVDIQSGAASSTSAMHGKNIFVQSATTGISRDAYGRFVASGTSATVRACILAAWASKTIKVYEGFIRVTRVG